MARMQPHIIEVADGFWNIRGSFEIGGVVEIGTQASLVKRSNGKVRLSRFLRVERGR